MVTRTSVNSENLPDGTPAADAFHKRFYLQRQAKIWAQHRKGFTDEHSVTTTTSDEKNAHHVLEHTAG